MLYLPYVRAGVSTSDWLIKVEYCYHTPDPMEATEMYVLHHTFPGDVWERGDSHCVCWCQTGFITVPEFLVAVKKNQLKSLAVVKGLKIPFNTSNTSVLGQSSNNISVE